MEKGATKVGAALVTVASMTVGAEGSYIGVNYGTDQLGLTQTQNLTPAELLRHNQQISNLAEGSQGKLFAIAGAITPYNGISYEPMRFEEGAGEPAVLSKASSAITPSQWPDNDGFIEGTIERDFLMPGYIFDRFGFAGGRYGSPANTPISMRSMRPGTENLPYNNYRVLKPIEVNTGGIAPAFNQPGLGTQHEFSVPIKILLKRGLIEEVLYE